MKFQLGHRKNWRGNTRFYAKRDKNYYERLLKELSCEDGKLIIYRKDGQIVDVRPYYEESKETEEVEKRKQNRRL